MRKHLIQVFGPEQAILLGEVIRPLPRISPESADHRPETFQQPSDVAADVTEAEHGNPGSL